MPLCGFNRKMIEGIVTFSEGLLEATLERGRSANVDDTTAVTIETEEIKLFIDALKEKYKRPEETSNQSAKMVYGVAIFAGGLFANTLEKAHSEDIDLKTTFDHEVRKIGNFLQELENAHQRLRKTNNPEQTMVKAVQWIDSNSVL